MEIEDPFRELFSLPPAEVWVAKWLGWSTDRVARLLTLHEQGPYGRLSGKDRRLAVQDALEARKEGETELETLERVVRALRANNQLRSATDGNPFNPEEVASYLRQVQALTGESPDNILAFEEALAKYAEACQGAVESDYARLKRLKDETP